MHFVSRGDKDACLFRSIVGSTRLISPWLEKKQYPVAKGLCIAAIAACRPCGIYNCVATLRIVKAPSAKILQNGRNSSMIALRLFSGSSCDVVFASLKPSLVKLAKFSPHGVSRRSLN